MSNPDRGLMPGGSGPTHRITNAVKRSEVYKKSKRDKAQAKLKRRMETRKLEKKGGKEGEEARKERLAKNIPRTLDNTRQFDSSSYLTANPEQLRALVDSRSCKPKVQSAVEQSQSDGEHSGDDLDDMEHSGDEEEDEEQEDEDMEAGPSRQRRHRDAEEEDGDQEDAEQEEGDGEEEAKLSSEDQSTQSHVPLQSSVPRILLTTSPSATRATYAFLEELNSVFPGGETYKRLKGRGFELGRIARWAAKREFQAMVVVNEDHKEPNAITIINLPAGPTAYFKLTSIALSQQIAGHARPSPHSPELILNNFTTLLGHSIGRLFGSLFPPQPMFRGRQVVTLHNQRDFLFFRRHRYMFASIEKARLQEIGPRFTLKLRWLRKGLPSVLAADGVAPKGEQDAEDEDEEEDSPEMEESEMDGQEPKPKKNVSVEVAGNGIQVPALDAEEEYEWKWKPKMEVSRRTFFL